MKKILLILVLLFSLKAEAQLGLLFNKYYITGSLSLGKGERNIFADTSALLEVGEDTTNRGVILSRVNGALVTTKRGVFFYNLQDSTLYHMDGTNAVKYLTLKDTTLIKAIVEGHTNDLTSDKVGNIVSLDINNGMGTSFSVADEDSSATNELQVLSQNGDTLFISGGNYVIIPETDLTGVRDTATALYDSLTGHWSQIYANYVAVQSRVPYSDSNNWLVTKTFLSSNYFANGGNLFGATATIGTNGSNHLDFETNNTVRGRIGSTGNWMLGTTTDVGYKLYVAGNMRNDITSNNTSPVFYKMVNGGAGASTGGAIEFPFNQRIQASFLPDGFILYNKNVTDNVAVSASLLTFSLAPTINTTATNGVLSIKSENGTSARVDIRGSDGVRVSTFFSGSFADRFIVSNSGSIYSANIPTVTTYDSVCVINDGVLNKVLFKISATATLDFPSTSPSSQSDLTVTVTGAALNDVVAIGTPNGATVFGAFTAWVSAANTVTVRFHNTSGGIHDPASGSFKIYVFK